MNSQHFFPMAKPVTVIGENACVYGIASFYVKDYRGCYVYLLGHKVGWPIEQILLNDSLLINDSDWEDIFLYNMKCVRGYDTNKGLILKRNSVGELKRFTKGEIELGLPICGEAYIYTTISGFEADFFSCQIVDVFAFDNYGMQFEILIDDKRLFDTFGGGVQGMSGSLILQNERPVSYTHLRAHET